MDQKREFVKLAKLLTTEQAIRQIEMAIADYKEAQLLNNKEEIEIAAEHVSATCHLYIFNQIPKTAEEILKEVDASHRASKFFQMDLN
jgi:hypothetical protein